MDVFWLQQDETGVAAGEGWLSRAEIETLRRFHIPKRRADWRLGRWTAKLAIAIHHKLTLDAEGLRTVEIRPESSGAPTAFVNGCPAALSLSLSHSEGRGFCSVSAAGTALGCDVETVTPHSLEFAEDYFTPWERERVASLPAADRDFFLTLLWSSKESALKAMRCGLRADTRFVTVRLGEWSRNAVGRWQPLTVLQTGSAIFQGWWRNAGNAVSTLVASPAPREPVELSKHSFDEG